VSNREDGCACGVAQRRRTRRSCSVTLLIWLLGAAGSLPAVAQPPEPPAAGAASSPETEVEALIRILEDDEARARLVERLRAASGDAAAEEAALAEQTLAGALAVYTRDVAEGAASIFGAMADLVAHVSDVLTGVATIDMQALRAVVLGVALVVAATFGVYVVLQLAFRRLQRSLAGSAASADMIRRAKLIGASRALDIGTILLAWGAGYVFALNIGEARQIGISESLFLNAFLIIELTKAASRVVLAPRWPVFRVAKLDDTSAAYWYFWLSRLVSLIGYTFLFVAPILAAGVSDNVAEAVRIIVLFTSVAIATAIILQNRDAVRARLTRRAADGRSGALARSLAAFARIWHIVAIGYLIVVFVLWLTNPETALPFVLAATGQSAVAIAVGVLLTTIIARFASGGMHLPADIKERLPLLERRLNAFVPNVLRVVRVVVTVGVIMMIVQAWNIANVGGWLASDAGQRTVTSLISAALILLVGGLCYLAGQSWVEYRLNPNVGTPASPRERTLLALFRNAFTIVLSVLVFMLVLSELGVNIGPLLAGAGVVGLAVGFGAQKLVQDVINGAFIQLENTMNEGDVVTAGGISGVVERLTIRSVSLRSFDGIYHVIPFSSVDTVSNSMKYFSYHVAAIGVAYRENIADVKQAMQEAFERLKRTEFGDFILGEFEMQGVVEFADSAVVVRARIMTVPGKQWVLGRAYNELVKEVFDERDIEIPFPHVTLYLGEGKDGQAPPLRIRGADGSGAGDTAAERDPEPGSPG
jgi:moderate conductance mechanosensitive channel